jgi:hypothetical protein
LAEDGIVQKLFKHLKHDKINIGIFCEDNFVFSLRDRRGLLSRGREHQGGRN